MKIKIKKDDKNRIIGYALTDGEFTTTENVFDLPEGINLNGKMILRDGVIENCEESEFFTYAEKRKRVYPSVGDQLDMLWHELNLRGSISINGEWFQACQTIKLDNPKE